MLTVVTHSEKFHTDEIMATTILDYLYSVSDIVRTRDQDQIQELNGQGAWVLDVGKVYDPGKHLYDHHQASFNNTFDTKTTIPLSSCGLIYFHHGKELIRKRLLVNNFDDFDKLDIDLAYSRFYHKFIVAIDANDNGIPYIKDSSQTNYSDPLTLIGLIAKHNTNDSDKQLSEFKKCMGICKIFLFQYLDSFLKDQIEFQKNLPYVQKAMNNCKHQNILVLPEKIDYYACLSHLDPDQDIKLIVLPREKIVAMSDVTIDPSTDCNWQIHTVNVKGKRFEQLVNILPESNAKEIIGNDLVFVHKNRFIGITKSQESAIELALKSLEKANKFSFNFNIGDSKLTYFGFGVLSGTIIGYMIKLFT
jgi:uncharacterized UPF0160 family protein